MFQTNKFIIVLVRLMLGKVGLERLARPPRKYNGRCEFGLKVFLKTLGCK